MAGMEGTTLMQLAQAPGALLPLAGRMTRPVEHQGSQLEADSGSAGGQYDHR